MILLSFDTEEFDVPREHGVDFPLDEAMKVSVYGTNRWSASISFSRSQIGKLCV